MKALSILILILIASCSGSRQEGSQDHKIVSEGPDTLIIRRDLSEEVAGSVYIEKAISYSLLIGQDSSRFNPIFIKTRNGGTINIDLNLSYSVKNESYKRRQAELAILLKEASKEFNIDSLKGINFGRLILSGDLAIRLSQEYKNKHGEGEVIRTSDYPKVSEFLKESSLGLDLDELLKPYSKTVKNVEVEKVFFAKKEGVISYGKLETDSSSIPSSILDCITWVVLE